MMCHLVRMTRRVGFSSGHRYWISSKSEAENKEIFGKWASPYNHGHNYLLDVTVEGVVDDRTGMVVNIKRIDDVLQSLVVNQFDGKSINDEIDYFQREPSTLENLLRYLGNQIGKADVLPSEVRLHSIRLEELPTFYGELLMSDPKDDMTLTRIYEFAASHRLDSPALTPSQNQDLYGKCNNPAGHGHNYILEVTVTGDPDPRTGMMVDLETLDQRVEELVISRYDHKNLNEDAPEFRGKTTTSEVVAIEIFNRLEGRLPVKLARLRLHETARNMFEVLAT